MKVSIQTKLIIISIFLVLMAIVSISIAYYIMTKRDKHRESQQRIHIAFDIIFDDMAEQLAVYTQKFDDFLQRDNSLALAVQVCRRRTTVGMQSTIVSQLSKASYILSINRLALYRADRCLLVEYYPATAQDAARMNWGKEGEDVPLFPSEEDIPKAIVSMLFSTGQELGIRIIAPLIQDTERVGVLVGDVVFTQNMVERYAALSKTAINFFTGNQYILGTLPEQSELHDNVEKPMLACEKISGKTQELEIFSGVFGEQAYYQGQCTLNNAQGTVGAISVSLSQEIEKQEVKKMLNIVLLISGIVIGVVSGLSVLVSQRESQSLHNIVTVIGAVAEGDLRRNAVPMTHDEIGMLANKLNQTIERLRNIHSQVQGAAHAVNGTADTILQQMDSLIRHMEQQSNSVDNTTSAMETITEFIDIVSQNTTDLLFSADQILASIQETRASIAEVTMSTGTLTTNFQNIFVSADQVNQTVKDISEHTGFLEEVAQYTEAEIHHIDQSLQDVSLNADNSQQLAKETMEAATQGQSSVDASLRGMTELKEVVANTAQIIREANSWGERVSEILGIVDEITEQTSLLALNASIISAQAGTHGRGFAVVANEIKELATRTKTSTQEIGLLVHELQVKTEEGVKNTEEGLKKADQGMQLVHAVKDSLTIILERATRSSKRAADTAQLIQQTAESSQVISSQITGVSDMVSKIRAALQEGEQDLGQIVVSVETISGMSEQVNRANLEQGRAAEEIERSMMDVTEKFNAISEQTETLQQKANQIVSAMHTIESTTGQTLQNATDISGSTVKNLVQQSDLLQRIVQIFKV